MTKVTQLKRVLAILVSVALLVSCISVAGWTVAAAETVWDFESEAIDGTNLSLYTGDSIKVSDEQNHTTGGGKSAKVISAQTAGNNRAQMIIKDGHGDAVTLAEGEIVQVSFWVYLPTQENNKSNNLRMWLTATDNDSVHSNSNPKNDAVVYEQGTGQFSVPVDTWHQVTVTTNGAHAGKLRLGIAGDNQGKQTTFYVDDITVTREEVAPPPEVTGTAYHYDFSVNNGMYNNADNGNYYGTAAAADSSHNNSIQVGVAETTVVPNGSGYAMQLAYTGNLEETSDMQRYAIFSLPNYTSATINKRKPGQSIHLEAGSVFKITVKYKVTGYTSPATLYVATYSGSEGALSGNKALTTDFADHEEIVRIEGTTADFETASVIHAPDMNNNLYLFLKMDDDTNRVGTKMLISEITITPVLAGTIRFNSNGGSAVSSISGAVGDAVTLPADPTRSGYTFQGWVNADGGAIPTTFVAGETTLTARWIPDAALVMDAEDLTADEPIQLNAGSQNTAAAATDYNVTYKGSQAIKVKGSVSTRARTQFFVKADGNQVVLEADKDYQLSFWYYIPVSEGDYSLKYWFTAGNGTEAYGANDNSFFDDVISVSDKTIDAPVKGAWTQVVVNVKGNERVGNLRMGVCGSAAYTLYVDDICVYEIPPFESDPNTMDFENNDTDAKLNINPNTAGTITVSDAYNHTENGYQSVKFAPADQGGGTRPQMMVKDGTGAQVMVEEGKNYEFTFWLYLEENEGNYGVNYWWAATEDETPFVDGAAKNAAMIYEAEVRSETSKGKWTKVTVTMASNRTGKLRLGICGSDSNSKTRTFYVDDIIVKEVVPYEQDPEVESFELYPLGTLVSIPNSTGSNKIEVSADMNITEGGTQSALVTSKTKGGGGRAQMLVKDGEGNQVMIEKDKSYTVTFSYFIPETEPDFQVNYWLTAADSEEFYTAGSQKDAVKLSEFSSPSTASKDVKGEWINVTANINNAPYAGKLRIGFADNTGALVHFYVDEIKVVEKQPAPALPSAGDAWDFESYSEGMGSEFFLHGTGKVSTEQNHTEGGSASLMVNKKTNAGIDRAQIVVLDPKTGEPLEMEKGETYTFSMWVYKPSDYGDMIALNLWLWGTDDLAKVNDKTGAEFDMGGSAHYEASDEWFEYSVSFTAKNGKYLVLGITDHSTDANQGFFYLDDIQLKEPEYMTIKFDSNGSADKYDDIVGIVGALIPFDGMDPYREGYEFTGWYTSKDCNLDSFFDIGIRTLTGKNGDVLTLYAGWKEWEIGDRIEFDEDDVVQREEKDEYRTEYYEEKVWVGDKNVPKPLDIGERPEAELETITDIPVEDEPNGEEPAKDGLPTWMIIVIIAAAVLVVGGGALAALLLSKKSKPTEENNA